MVHRQELRSEGMSAVMQRRLRMRRRKTTVSVVGVRHGGWRGGRRGSSQTAGTQPENVSSDMEKTEDAEEEGYGERGWRETRGSGGGEGGGGSSEAAGVQPENVAGDTEKTESGEVEDYGECG